MSKNYILTAEMVSDGHPDKIADQISDAVLDLYLSHDKDSKVACETFVQKGIVFIGGEVTSKAKKLDIEPTVRSVINDIGYNSSKYGFNGNSVAVINNIVKQSPEIYNAVTRGGKISAGDQGIMYGFASNETYQYIRLNYYLARSYIQAVRNNIIGFKGFRPDVKSQVSIEYDGITNKPIHVDTVIISASHDPEYSLETIREKLLLTVRTVNSYVLDKSFKNLFSDKTKYIFNHAGTFINCGPAADTGLTGRKIVVDQMNTVVGGGALSSKDPSKVDRSAAYYARYIAKNIVHANLADEALIEVSYVIGKDEPISINLTTKNKKFEVSDSELINSIAKKYSFSVSNIIEELQLKSVKYLNTAKYGHYGLSIYPWEKIIHNFPDTFYL